MSLKPMDQQKLRQSRGQPKLPAPKNDTKNSVLTEPARFDEIHQFSLQVMNCLGRGKISNEKLKKKSELDGMLDSSCEAFKKFTFLNGLSTVLVLQAMGIIKFNENFQDCANEMVDIDDFLQTSQNAHNTRDEMLNVNYLANMLGFFNNENDTLNCKKLQSNILKTTYDSKKARISNSIVNNNPQYERYRSSMQKNEVNTLIDLHSAIQEGVNDYQNSIIGVAFQNALSGDRFDICI